MTEPPEETTVETTVTEPLITTEPIVTTEPQETSEPPSETTGPPEQPPEIILGDANGDGKLNVRDAAYIARMLSQGRAEELPPSADFNQDGKVNVRDAAAIAIYIAMSVMPYLIT